MIGINKNFAKLGGDYLFKEVAAKVGAFKQKNGDEGLISLGIGDVSLPLVRIVTDAFSSAVKGMGTKSGFHGYAPVGGYGFLRESICALYAERGVNVSADEIFVSDGAKSDIANLIDLFGRCDVLLPSPVYPAYADANVLSGNVVDYLIAEEKEGFIPLPDGVEKKRYLIYLCSPNNPTGVVYSKKTLEKWVNFALETGSVIIFDGAYSEFITGDEPRSVFEVEGAENCAIEINSFSKRAGFTGVRCGWAVVPKRLDVGGESLNGLWVKRQSIKFNGVGYPVQAAANAALSKDGRAQCGEQIKYYLENADILARSLVSCGLKVFGAKNAPYVWVRCPLGLSGWETFERLLYGAGLVCTPGEGFGEGGKGYIRLTAFGTRKDTLNASKRLETFFKNMR